MNIRDTEALKFPQTSSIALQISDRRLKHAEWRHSSADHGTNWLTLVNWLSRHSPPPAVSGTNALRIDTKHIQSSGITSGGLEVLNKDAQLCFCVLFLSTDRFSAVNNGVLLSYSLFIFLSFTCTDPNFYKYDQLLGDCGLSRDTGLPLNSCWCFILGHS